VGGRALPQQLSPARHNFFGLFKRAATVLMSEASNVNVNNVPWQDKPWIEDGVFLSLTFQDKDGVKACVSEFLNV